MELINFVVVGHVNATASHHAAVPFAIASHQFMGAAAGINNCAGVAIIAVQSMVPLGSDHPYDRVIGTIGRSNPRRAVAVLAHVPREYYCRRICRSNLIGLNLTAVFRAKNKICPLCSRVGRRRLAFEGSINACRRDWRSDTTQVVTVNQIRIAILAQGEHQV
jgi:hypothetical protein